MMYPKVMAQPSSGRAALFPVFFSTDEMRDGGKQRETSRFDAKGEGIAARRGGGCSAAAAPYHKSANKYTVM